ncbi:ribosomal protein RPL6 [Toxoplasma gondii ME49]|uniref:Ribosomal protein RPL6 n=2 Tax=Toxoplasma gondii TaxID=5811 RepID=A0A125YZB5_TOXGV|nr:ribosomal protein RPL6 [Toxoplasma gondii ME49]EPT25923.1 ribosomal protein RPL6 [Toxoplasma gondii ME49]ESS35066.1 ribosomal protein RPL6 [Toxoplasma gondii VEG]|eukprot:XP_002364550.2 ribosomal protein RPL6 [Toxoplasma gondii ME49]
MSGNCQATLGFLPIASHSRAKVCFCVDCGTAADVFFFPAPLRALPTLRRVSLLRCISFPHSTRGCEHRVVTGSDLLFVAVSFRFAFPVKMAPTAAALAKKRLRTRKPKRQLYKSPAGAAKRMAKLRSSITPGTVLILLSGGHRGKRVVFLKQLAPSGLLLVTGPFKVNGVPLRRVNQRYVIATTTKVDISGVDVSSIKDEQFGASKKEKFAERKLRKKQDEGMFVQQSDSKAKQALPAQFKQLQDSVDKALLASLSKDKLLTQYLKTRFTLRGNMRPHEMKF